MSKGLVLILLRTMPEYNVALQCSRLPPGQSGAARILVQDVVDVLESLFKHALIFLVRDANVPRQGKITRKRACP